MVELRITGCVLAGGRGARFGGQDKGLLELAGRPLTAHVLDRLRPQVDDLVISVNRNVAAYGALAGRTVADTHGDYAGPLAGIAAALHAAATPLVMVVPCDSPFIPRDLVFRLQVAMREQAAAIATVRTGGWLQPIFGLLSRELLADLLVFLDGGGRKVDTWYARHTCAEVELGADCAAFMNINTADDLATAAAQAVAQAVE